MTACHAPALIVLYLGWGASLAVALAGGRAGLLLDAWPAVVLLVLAWPAIVPIWAAYVLLAPRDGDAGEGD